jgi:hypothetical protein
VAWVTPLTRRDDPRREPTQRGVLTRFAEPAVCGLPASLSGAAETANLQVAEEAAVDFSYFLCWSASSASLFFYAASILILLSNR